MADTQVLTLVLLLLGAVVGWAIGQWLFWKLEDRQRRVK
jgi:hypothetical protein